MTIAPTDLNVQVIDGTTVKCSWDYQDNQYLVGGPGAPADLQWSHNWSENTFVSGQANVIQTQNGSVVKHSHSNPHIDAELFGGAADAGGAKPLPFSPRRYASVPNALRCFSTTLDNTVFGSIRQEVVPDGYRPNEGDHLWFGTSIYYDPEVFERYSPIGSAFAVQLLEQGSANLLISVNHRGGHRWRIDTDGAFPTVGDPIDFADHMVGRHLDVIYGIHLHPTNGWLKVWVDGRKIFDETGGNCGYREGGSYFYLKFGAYAAAAKNASNGIINTDCLAWYSTTRVSNAVDGFDTVAPSPCNGFVLKLYEDGNLVDTINPTDPYMGPAVREYTHTVANTSGKTYTATLQADRQGVLSDEISSVEGPTVSLPLVVSVTEPADLSANAFVIPCAPQIDDLLILCNSVDGTTAQSGSIDILDAGITFTRIAGDEVGVNTKIPDESANGFVAWRRATQADVDLGGSYNLGTCTGAELAGILMVRVSGIEWGADPWAGPPARNLVNSTASYTSPVVTTTEPDALVMSILLNVGSWQPGTYPTTTETRTSADSILATSGRASIAMTTKVTAGDTPSMVWSGADATTSGAKIYTLAISGSDKTSPPVWNAISDQSTFDNEGAKTLDLSQFVTSDAGALTNWAISVSPANAEFSVDSNGLLTLAADPTAGTYTITPSVDNTKGTTSAAFDWEVTAVVVTPTPVLLTITEPADLSNSSYTIPCSPEVDDLLIVCAAIDGTTAQTGNADITDATFTRIAGDELGANAQIGSESANGFVAWRRADGTDVGKTDYTLAAGNFELAGVVMLRLRGVDWTGGNWWSVAPSRTASAASATTHTASGVTTVDDNTLIVSVLLTLADWEVDSYPTNENAYESLDSVSSACGQVALCAEMQNTAGATGDQSFGSTAGLSREAKTYLLPIKTQSDGGTAPLLSVSAVPNQTDGTALINVQSNTVGGVVYAAWYSGAQSAKLPNDVKVGTGALGNDSKPGALVTQFAVPALPWESDYFTAVVQETSDVGYSQVFYTDVQDWTFARTSEATVVDFEGNIKELPNDAAAHPGARVVRNLVPTQDFNEFTVVGTPSFALNGDGSYRITLPANSGYYVRSNLYDNTVRFKTTDYLLFGFSLKYVSGSSTHLRIQDAYGGISASVNNIQTSINSEFQRYSTAAGVESVANNPVGPWIRNDGTGEIVLDAKDAFLELVTGQSNQNPSEFVTDVQSFDYENGNTVDVNGVVTEGPVVAIAGLEGVLLEGSRTNILLNSDAPATQSVTVAAAPYTLTMTGAGSVDISGVSTGTATEAVPLTFTPSAGSLTATVVGSVDTFQLEAGAFPSSYIQTAGATETRAATAQVRTLASMGLADITSDATVTLTTRLQFDSAITGENNLLTIGDATNGLRIYVDGTTVGFRKFVAGTAYNATATYAYTDGELLTIVVTHAGTGTTIDCNAATGSQANGDALAVAASTVTLEPAFQVVQGVDIV